MPASQHRRDVCVPALPPRRPRRVAGKRFHPPDAVRGKEVQFRKVRGQPLPAVGLVGAVQDVDEGDHGLARSYSEVFSIIKTGVSLHVLRGSTPPRKIVSKGPLFGGGRSDWDCGMPGSSKTLCGDALSP